jgi:hypothetical protein
MADGCPGSAVVVNPPVLFCQLSGDGQMSTINRHSVGLDRRRRIRPRMSDYFVRWRRIRPVASVWCVGRYVGFSGEAHYPKSST